MEPREVYETWAPPGGSWSPWAKPVLFAHLREAVGPPPVAIPEVPIPAVLTPVENTALVLDLPGLEAIGLGLSLVRVGFRPVPLFNGCPIPLSAVPAVPEVVAAELPAAALPHEVVSTRPLLWGLLRGADLLRSSNLPPDVPPAFLLDAHRYGGDWPVTPGCFDNRWVVFPTDFPSATFLASRGITRVQVLHRAPLREDLVDVLRTWQRQGLALSHVNLTLVEGAGPLVLPSAWWAGFGRLARRLWALFTLRRNPRGGFGGFVPEPSASGG